MIVKAIDVWLHRTVDDPNQSTRELWRKKYYNASDQEARDPRPFREVLKERDLDQIDQMVKHLWKKMGRDAAIEVLAVLMNTETSADLLWSKRFLELVARVCDETREKSVDQA